MKAFRYRNGKTVECRLSQAGQTRTLALLHEMFSGTDDILRVRVSEQLAGRIRTTETALEFVFDKPTPFTSRIHGKYSLRRILLPLTGDYAGSGKDAVVTLFVANDEGFISGPLRNSQASPVLLKLQDILLSPARNR